MSSNRENIVVVTVMRTFESILTELHGLFHQTEQKHPLDENTYAIIHDAIMSMIMVVAGVAVDRNDEVESALASIKVSILNEYIELIDSLNEERDFTPNEEPLSDEDIARFLGLSDS